MSEEKEKTFLGVSGDKRWTEVLADNVLTAMSVEERFNALEKLFLERAKAYDDKATLELLGLLRRAYFEKKFQKISGDSLPPPTSRGMKVAQNQGDVDFALYLGERLYYKLPDRKIYSEKIISQAPTLVDTKIKMFESILPFWRSEGDNLNKVFRCIDTMFDPMHGYVSKAEQDKMRPLLQKHLEENFSWEELRFLRGYPSVSEKMKTLLSIAMLRKAGPSLIEREIILDAIFGDIDVLKLSEEKISEMRKAILDVRDGRKEKCECPCNSCHYNCEHKVRGDCKA